MEHVVQSELMEPADFAKFLPVEFLIMSINAKLMLLYPMRFLAWPAKLQKYSFCFLAVKKLTQCLKTYKTCFIVKCSSEQVNSQHTVLTLRKFSDDFRISS